MSQNRAGTGIAFILRVLIWIVFGVISVFLTAIAVLSVVKLLPRLDDIVELDASALGHLTGTLLSLAVMGWIWYIAYRISRMLVRQLRPRREIETFQ